MSYQERAIHTGICHVCAVFSSPLSNFFPPLSISVNVKMSSKSILSDIAAATLGWKGQTRNYVFVPRAINQPFSWSCTRTRAKNGGLLRTCNSSYIFKLLQLITIVTFFRAYLSNPDILFWPKTNSFHWFREDLEWHENTKIKNSHSIQHDRTISPVHGQHSYDNSKHVINSAFHGKLGENVTRTYRTF